MEMFRNAAAIGALLASASLANAQDGAAGGPSNKQLVEKLLRMEERMRSLELRLKQSDARRESREQVAGSGKKKRGSGPPAVEQAQLEAQTVSLEQAFPKRKGILGLVDSPVQGLTMGAYGEIKYGRRQNPSANGTWQNSFDATRFVLLPTFAITDNIIFNAEIEFEHAGSGFDSDDKLHGTAEVEQLFIDFKVNKFFNFRAPGIDLVPIGYINQHHEPTLFYSVNRPELYNGLIPSTWKAPASSIYGRLTDGLSYQLQISHSVEDFGSDFSARTDGNRVAPFPAGYAPGISGTTALGSSRAPLGDFRQMNNTYAVSGRLDYSPSFIPGLAGSVSAYYSANVTPRGAYSDFGTPLGKTSLAMFDAEFRYRMPGTGLEVRGEYVRVNIGNPGALRANNDTDPTNNVGKHMDGYSGEVAYHIPIGAFLGSEWEAVPFYRYTRENLQAGGYSGTDLNLPIGAGQLQFHTAGIAFFPSSKVVLKASYQKVKSKQIGGPQSDSVLGAVGFFF